MGLFDAVAKLPLKILAGHIAFGSMLQLSVVDRLFKTFEQFSIERFWEWQIANGYPIKIHLTNSLTF